MYLIPSKYSCIRETKVMLQSAQCLSFKDFDQMLPLENPPKLSTQLPKKIATFDFTFKQEKYLTENEKCIFLFSKHFSRSSKSFLS